MFLLLKKKKNLKKCNLLEWSFILDVYCISMNIGSYIVGQRERKGLGIYLFLEFISVIVESMVSKEWF